MNRLVACALILAVTSGACGVGAAEPDPSPIQAIRTLQNLQDRIASGDTIAAAAHSKTIGRIASAFVAAKPALWGDERNARALILYLFSGGDAAAITKAIPPSALAKGEQGLYSGALAYGLGEDDKARDALMPIDPKKLPSALGGHLALVQAILVAGSDPAKAITLLDLARLLEPGTLVEEAALRKEMSLISPVDGDLQKFAMLARRYVGTFPRSVYVQNFQQLLTQAATQIGDGDTVVAGARLLKLLEGLGKAEQRRLCLAIARNALVTGHMTMAAFLSEQAEQMAETGSQDHARALVYFGAATIAGSRYDAGVKALATAAVPSLDESDQALRSSAVAVAEMIRGPSFATQTNRGDTDAAVLRDGERALADAEAAMKTDTK